MPLIYLVRHGRAAAAWDADPDPGLDALGQQQAQALVDRFRPLGPMSVLVSPMARARETAAPLLHHWAAEPRVEPRVSEIPSPVEDLQARGAWLRGLAQQEYAELDEGLRSWRQGILDALRELPENTVVFTHFIAINAAAGAALNNDRVVHFRPDHCSVTVLETSTAGVRLVSQGAEAETRVL
ncbi:MAG: histidine phosphatase family protein [Ectothiorhodospiraceae bacterium]|nr:histidine phosphatase family protein [Ectothiorhodospiraceae bacterium]MCH8503235.1 histidine phosphatase family protein [Ectothiorhodospiraceae bacterium]